MSRRLYVGNLAWAVTDQDLRDLFAEAGKVENSQVIVDRETNRSRGFGFVEMASDESADAAIKKFNGRHVKGRAIRVNEAQSRGAGGGRDRQRRSQVLAIRVSGGLALKRRRPDRGAHGSNPACRARRRGPLRPRAGM